MKQNRVVNLPRSNFFLSTLNCMHRPAIRSEKWVYVVCGIHVCVCVRACERENTSEGRSKGGKKTKKVIMAASRLDHPSSIHQSSPINKFNK